MNLDVTQTITVDDLILDPCPYFCIRNALPETLYNQLSAEYPEAHMMQDSKTTFQARRYRQHEFVPGTISPLWQEFVDYHTSQMYKDRVLSLFAPALEKYYPDLTTDLITAPVTPRHSGDPGVQMELQFVLNGQQEETVRTIHLDNSRELFAGLLYMRKPEDQSTGGDIQMFRKTVARPEYYSGTREVNPAHVEWAGTVPYRANTMVLFLNTADTLHGVTPRVGANCFRRYINIDAHQDRKLFQV